MQTVHTCIPAQICVHAHASTMYDGSVCIIWYRISEWIYLLHTFCMRFMWSFFTHIHITHTYVNVQARQTKKTEYRAHSHTTIQNTRIHSKFCDFKCVPIINSSTSDNTAQWTDKIYLWSHYGRDHSIFQSRLKDDCIQLCILGWFRIILYRGRIMVEYLLPIKSIRSRKCVVNSKFTHLLLLLWYQHTRTVLVSTLCELSDWRIHQNSRPNIPINMMQN